MKEREPFPPVPRQPTYPARGLLGLAVMAAFFFGAYEVGWWWMLAVIGGGILLLMVSAATVGIVRGVSQARTGRAPEPVLDTPIRSGDSGRQRLQSHVLQLAGDSLALLICGRFIPGISLSGARLLIAVSVISVPTMAAGEYLAWRRVRYTEALPNPIRWMAVALFAVAWPFAAPAVADQATSDFNIGGFWQYVVLVVLLYLVGFTAWRFVEAGKALARGR